MDARIEAAVREIVENYTPEDDLIASVHAVVKKYQLDNLPDLPEPAGLIRTEAMGILFPAKKK